MRASSRSVWSRRYDRHFWVYIVGLLGMGVNRALPPVRWAWEGVIDRELAAA